MVGSSARATCDGPVSALEGGGVGVLSTRGGGGGGGGGGATATGVGVLAAGGGGGGGGGATAVACGWGNGGGRLPVAPGMKEKSSASDDEIHGTCSPREARGRATRGRLTVCPGIRA